MAKFSDDTVQQLQAPLSRSAVKERKQSGRTLSYVEGWHAIAEANRIFGFDAWARETIDIRVVSEKPRKIGANKEDGWGVTYICKVRVDAKGVVREGCGAGHGIDRDLGQAHESALKEAETDAMKRALMTFGNPFGLALYDKTQANVVDIETAEPAGDWPVMIPGKNGEEEFTRCASAEIWVAEMNDLANRIRNSSKMDDAQKDEKVAALRVANVSTFDRVPQEAARLLTL